MQSFLAADSRQYPKGADNVQKVFLAGKDAIIAHSGVGVIPDDDTPGEAWDAAKEIGEIATRMPSGTLQAQLLFVEIEVVRSLVVARSKPVSTLRAATRAPTIAVSAGAGVRRLRDRQKWPGDRYERWLCLPERVGLFVQRARGSSGSVLQSHQRCGALVSQFRFALGSNQLDDKAVVDLDRVVGFISDHHYAGNEVLLLGFADSIGPQERNLRLSKDRARVVSTQFEQWGLKPAVVTGFGQDLPVASNDSDEGREKNRRRRNLGRRK
jgi:outer membrane protein OmpA-like peptidoglycan-associated protein